MKKRTSLPALLPLLAGLSACGSSSPTAPGGPTAPAPTNRPSLRIVSGSENKTLEPVVNRFAQQNHANISMEYLGSVDLALRLEDSSLADDAVWPANSLWIALGDKHKQVKDEKSIMRSPVVFGVKKSVAERLGWTGEKRVLVEDLMKAAQAGKLRFMMTSATQSNSGASAYIGYLYAFSGHPEVLTSAHLKDPRVRDRIKSILGTVNRSAGSSGWLKDLFLQKYDQYDAMVNYEAVVIEANQELVKQGKEPLYAVYPADGLAIADSPLGYVDHGDAAKQALFQKLQDYLLSPDVQKEIMQSGRRVGLLGMDVSGADPAVFNKDWGIRPELTVSPIRFPKPEVIREALDLYQTTFRKPSFTVYCLDYSGSMQGAGEEQLKSAMRVLLDPEQSRRYYLQPSAEDVSIVLPFSDHILDEWTVTGNKADELTGLFQKVNAQQPGGGTDIYSPIMRGVDLMKQRGNLGRYFPAVILMTDGKSNRGPGFPAMQQHFAEAGLNADLPVFSILFGDADDSQLKQIATYSSGRVFDGRKDLITAFKEAKGYNN